MNPNTVVTLYATDFDISNRYVVKAESEGEALGAVSSYPNKVYPDCYWQRDASAFRATGNINDVKKYNYCTFENNGKLNFAFITDFTYINDDMTLCHIEIDPWLNYAGQYVFNDSPMRRCHPKTDSVLEGSFATEPVQITKWISENYETGNVTDDESGLMFLVTQIDATSLPQNANSLSEGLFNVLNNINYTALSSWFGLALNSQPCQIGNKLQATTYHVYRGQAQSILANMGRNGLGDKVVCCYQVPKFFDNSVPVGSMPISKINNPDKKSITASGVKNWGGNTIYWNKIKYSPQFNQLIMNLCGNAKEVPWGFLDANKLITSQPLQFELGVDLTMDGCATMRIADMDTAQGENYNFIVHSPTWDRVQMVGIGSNQNKLYQAEFGYISGIIRAGIAYGVNPALGAYLATGIPERVAGRANKMQAIANEGVVSTGGGGGSISGWGRVAPLISISHYYPMQTEFVKLQEYFGTYGYTWNGQVQPIEFGYMPHWNYYETEDASITGKAVPQKDLAKIINRFNEGIFVFNSIGDYKKFGNCMANHL